jgi:hypothetical protein
MTLRTALLQLLSQPLRLLVHRWNWKAALTSSLVRGAIFLVANLAAGWRAALGAMLAEWLFRGLTSGFYGALTQTLGEVEPGWHGSVAAMVLLPVVSHSLEFTVHMLRHTARLRTSIVSSLLFTVVSTLFNIFAMRRGALIVGTGARSLLDDLRAMPAILGGFLIVIPRRTWQTLRGRPA